MLRSDCRELYKELRKVRVVSIILANTATTRKSKLELELLMKWSIKREDVTRLLLFFFNIITSWKFSNSPGEW